MSRSLIGNSARQRWTSPADGIALPARIRAALERAVLEPAHGAHPRARRREVRHVADDVPETLEAVANVAAHAALDLQQSRLVRMRDERPREASRDDPRRFDRGLRVHPE